MPMYWPPRKIPNESQSNAENAQCTARAHKKALWWFSLNQHNALRLLKPLLALKCTYITMANMKGEEKRAAKRQRQIQPKKLRQDALKQNQPKNGMKPRNVAVRPNHRLTPPMNISWANVGFNALFISFARNFIEFSPIYLIIVLAIYSGFCTPGLP